MSGAGSAAVGGRFNRKGEPTLYLALDIMTAVNECTQGLVQRLQPLTMCEYDIDCDPVADLRTVSDQDALGVTLDDLACGWLSYMRAGKDAPSWLVVDALRAEGFVGMVAPSFAPGATPANCNLILWQWSDAPPTTVSVFDPSDRLPKDQTSWGAGTA